MRLSRNTTRCQTSCLSAEREGVVWLVVPPLCVVARFFDRVFVHREATQIGPPVFEWAISKLYCPTRDMIWVLLFK